jgi:hypothetical protein
MGKYRSVLWSEVSATARATLQNWIRKIQILLSVAMAACYFSGAVSYAGDADQVLAAAFAEHRSNFQVEDGGQVTRVLADDNAGSRHQRFIVRLASGQTLLVAHNIDLAERISTLTVGDYVEFSGEYKWDARGGLIHWTHRDPRGRHVSGWVSDNGHTYR